VVAVRAVDMTTISLFLFVPVVMVTIWSVNMLFWPWWEQFLHIVCILAVCVVTLFNRINPDCLLVASEKEHRSCTHISEFQYTSGTLHSYFFEHVARHTSRGKTPACQTLRTGKVYHTTKVSYVKLPLAS
jgi:hypothetical protein